MGSELDTSLWHVLGQRQPAESWLHEQGHGHRLREGIVPLHMVLLRAQLEVVSSLGPQHSKHLEKWGELEGPFLVAGLEHLVSEESLRKLGWFDLEMRQIWGHSPDPHSL